MRARHTEADERLDEARIIKVVDDRVYWNVWWDPRGVSLGIRTLLTEELMTETQKTPKHFWIISIVALLWNLMGAYDYLMTQTKNEAYMSKFPPEQLEFFYGLPLLIVSTWAIAVWGGLLGAALLLLRKGMAVWVLLASFLCMVVTTIHNYFIADGVKVMGSTGVIFTILIFVIALGLFLYARAMKSRGVLV